MRIEVPGGVLQIVQKLESAGHEAWCVGGAVRDSLLGLAHLDWDIATSARPDAVQRLFRRTVPLGVEFGTVGVLDSDGVLHEVTTFRRDVETDGRHAKVVFGASLEEDLARRDFTVNAMAFSPTRGEFRDPFNGMQDLRESHLRTVGDADERMLEDRLRALRAIRFAARFSLSIDEDTWGAVCRSAPFLGRLSAERVRQELEKTMDQVVRPSAALILWRESGAFTSLIPPLQSVSDLQLTYPDYLPIPGPPARPARRSNRLTALFLSAGADQVRHLLRDLRFSNAEVGWISGQVERWVKSGEVLLSALASGDDIAPVFWRRLVAGVGRTRAAPLVRVAAAVAAARCRSAGGSLNTGRWMSAYRRVVRTAYRDPVELSDLAVDGDDLRAAGVPPGPALGRILAELLTRVVEAPERNTRDELLRIAGELAPAYTKGT